MKTTENKTLLASMALKVVRCQRLFKWKSELVTGQNSLCNLDHLTVNRPTNIAFASSNAATTRKNYDRIQLDDEEFSVLVIPGHTKVPERKREMRQTRREVPPPRYKAMNPDQDWTSVWPAAQSFKWSVVPLPVRQGYIEKSENAGIPPGKYANAELIKIPNFLHLTPNHVQKHCAAIKQLCNAWPRGLESDLACNKHFPISVTTRDYLVDSASIRDMRARTVTVKIPVSTLNLNYHARDKLIRLAGHRYDADCDTLTLETDQCPLKKQNYDYAMYLLTALYNEAWRVESWESDKTLADMEKYFWDLNVSRTALLRTLQAIKQSATESSEVFQRIPACVRSLPDNPTDDDVVSLPEAQEYKVAVTELLNEEEDHKALQRYKEAVKRLLLNTSSTTQDDRMQKLSQ